MNYSRLERSSTKSHPGNGTTWIQRSSYSYKTGAKLRWLIRNNSPINIIIS